MEYVSVDVSRSAAQDCYVVTSFAFRARFPLAKWKAMIEAARSGSDGDALDLVYVWMSSPAVDLRVIAPLVAVMMGTSKPAAYQLTQGEYDAIIHSPATPVELPMDLRYAQGMSPVPSDEEIAGGV